MIEIKKTVNLIPGDIVIDHGLEFYVNQIVRLRKRSQIMFTVGDPGQEKQFTVSAINTKEWRVSK